MAVAERSGRSIREAVVPEGRAAGLDGTVEGRANTPCEPLEIPVGQVACGAMRLDARSKERFIGVDVPDARNSLLVQQNGLDRPSAPPEPVSKGFSIDQGGFGSKPPQDSLIAILGALEEMDPSETPWVDEVHSKAWAPGITSNRPGHVAMRGNSSPKCEITHFDAA